ncbi:Phosphoglycerate kinase [Astathelohania contejeani]|uniref:Phosphoglycerate kinase n=1 Tax=Astathelohania contejeani TaxID=164912 RepID=A0ABQ7HZH1_9MICR|nr:Phosphoglycerate kinase [Thelohania contejeani]
MPKKSIKDTNLKYKRIFLRVDYNVPIVKRQVVDDFRIKQTIPTIKYLLDSNVKKIYIGSHLGRPHGIKSEALSSKPVYNILKEILSDIKIGFGTIGEELPDNKIVLLENLRFHAAEEKYDAQLPGHREYRNWFMAYCDLVVMDAFGCLHRDETSITRTGLPVVSGLLVEKELKIANELLNGGIDLVILGGAKISDKLRLIKTLLERKVKKIFLGGGMCFTVLSNFFEKDVGRSLHEENMKAEITSMYEKAKEVGAKIILPVDYLVIDNESKISSNIMNNEKAVDIGPKSIKVIEDLIKESDTIFWNGPPGKFEDDISSEGTKILIKMLQEHVKMGKRCVAGGGDTASAISMFGFPSEFTYVSTGGGSFLRVLEGGELPGLDAIENIK